MSSEPQSEPQTSQPDRDPAAVAPAEPQLSLMDVWRTVMKQRWVIVAVTAICFFTALIYSIRAKPVYESYSRIEVKPNTMLNMGLLAQASSSEGNSPDMATEILKLQSDSVMLETAQNLHLLDRLRTGGSKDGRGEGRKPAGPMTPLERLAMIGMISGGLTVKPMGQTQMVEIRYRNEDPKLATDVVNDLVDTYIDADLRSTYERTRHVSAWLQGQLDDLKQAASDAQRQLADYQRQHNIVGTDETSNLTIQTLEQISSDYESAESDRIVKEARMRDFATQGADLVSLTGDDPQVATLRSQLTDLETQRSQMTLQYGSRYPAMENLNAQIAKVQAALNREVELAHQQVVNEYEGALHLEGTLRKRLDEQEEAAYELNEDVAQYAILRHQAELNRDLYDALQMRLKEASVTAGLSATNITVVDRAQVPVYPVGPRKTLNVLIGLVGGLFAGVLIAFAIESIDDRMQTSEEVETVSHLASLATIPHIVEAQEKKRRAEEAGVAAGVEQARQLVTLHSPKSLAGEAYRGLRSALLLSSIDHPPRVIVFTSAFPGEGKTTTAANCAIALAQRGERVLLVDADLRRGSLDRVFGVTDRNFGLSSVLAHPGEQRQPSAPLPEVPMLHVLPTGPRPPNPAEMLSSHRMEEQVRQWVRDFDRVVIDSAPVLAVSDAQALAVLAETVVLVVRAGVTRKRALIRARDLLWRINAPVAGVVVNDVDMRLENFYTYRYGMYGYQYGYGYPYTEAYGSNSEEKEGGE